MDDKKEHMVLCESIINIFGDKLRQIFKREASDKKYMNQTILGCRFRSFIAIMTAVLQSFKSMYRVLALAIAKHRQDNHGENKQRTQESLTKRMSSEEFTAATTRGWSG